MGCSKAPLISLRSRVARSISCVRRLIRELGPLTETATVVGRPTATWSSATPSTTNGRRMPRCEVVVLLLVTNSQSRNAMPTAASFVGQLRASRSSTALKVAQAPLTSRTPLSAS